MDPTLKNRLIKNKDYIFSYLVTNFFYFSTKLTLDDIESEEHISECKKEFFDLSTEDYEIKPFVDKYITLDPYKLNVVTMKEIFNFYKQVNKDNNYTIKKDYNKFCNALFGCLLAKPEFASIDIVNKTRKHESNYYKGGYAKGIKGILLDNTFSPCIDIDLFVLSNALKKREDNIYNEYGNLQVKRYIIDEKIYYKEC